MSYIAQFPLDNLPPDAQRLFLLTLSLAEVAPAVEQFGQPQVVDGYDIEGSSWPAGNECALTDIGA